MKICLEVTSLWITKVTILAHVNRGAKKVGCYKTAFYWGKDFGWEVWFQQLASLEFEVACVTLGGCAWWLPCIAEALVASMAQQSWSLSCVLGSRPLVPILAKQLPAKRSQPHIVNQQLATKPALMAPPRQVSCLCGTAGIPTLLISSRCRLSVETVRQLYGPTVFLRPAATS